MPDDQSPEEHSMGPSGPRATTGMSTAEQLIGLGALLILVVADIIGYLIVQEYSPGVLLWGTAGLAVAAIVARRFGGWTIPVPYGWLLAFLGYAAGVLGVYDLVADVVFGLEGSDVIFALSDWAGAALMAVGAYMASRGSKAQLEA